MNRTSRIAIIIISIFVISTLSAVAVESFTEIKVLYRDIKMYVNKEQVLLDEEPFIYDDRVYVPVRFVSESLNASVQWNEEENAVSIFTFKDFNDAEPLDGEKFLYGEILSINRDERTLDIYQHIDDNSVSLDEDLKVSSEVVIILQRNGKKMNLNFSDLKIGDIAGFIVNKENEVRSIVISI